MKTLLTLLVAVSGMIVATSKAAACDYPVVVYAAPYRVSTREVSRCSYCRTAYDRCGNAYHYTITVVSYRDFYSDGSSRSYTRTFRA